MDIDLTNLLIGIIPSIITAIISYIGATKKSESDIFAVKEATKRDIESIKADTDREIEKIKADTDREIEKIKADTDREIEKILAQTDSQIKIMEAESKSKENEKMNEIMFGMLQPVMSDPDKLEKLLKIGKNPTQKDIIDLLK